MLRTRTLVIAGAALCLSAAIAAAQSNGLTNGPNGTQPNTLGSRSQSSGINSKMPSREITNPNSGFYKDTGAKLIHRHRSTARHRHQSRRP